MNITTSKQLPLLITFTLLTACSTQNTSVSGSQSSLGGQQSAPGSQSGRLGGQSSPSSQENNGGRQTIPGSQLLSQQRNKDTAPTKLANGTTRKLQKLPKLQDNNSKMRKIVLKAPKTNIAKRAPAKVMSKPTMTKPRTSGMTRPAPPMRPTTSFTRPAPALRPRSNTVPRTTIPFTTADTSPNRPAVPARRPVAPVRRPPPARKPVAKPAYSSGLISNPVRSAPPARPARPVAKPVVRAPVAKKPQSTLRRLTLNGSANFKSGSSRLTPIGQTKLLALSLSLQEGSTQISRLLVEGHTDSVGKAAMNQALSLRRANSVADYLAKKGGFQRSIMTTVGHGESKPVASNKTRKGRAQNRRVEISATGTRRITR